MDNEGLSIDASGNVGIGTSSPNHPLEVQGGNIALHRDHLLQFLRADGTPAGNIGSAWSGLSLYENRGGTTTNLKVGVSGDAFEFQHTTGGVIYSRLHINSAGEVGIGTNNPTKAKLEIDGSAGSTAMTYGYLNSSGNTGTGSGSNSLSLYASGRVAASEFNAHSDRRIKDISGLSNTQNDLQTLMQIEITDYTLLDTIAKGKNPQKKVIAQQVAEVYPQAVSTNLTEIIPDIYQRANVENGWIILATDLKVGERVKLITKNKNEVYQVIEVEEDRFKVSALTPDFSPLTQVPSFHSGQCFVYGREVSDFHTVDYEAISMLNVSATQEQQKVIENLKAELSQLQKINTLIQEKNHTLTQQLNELQKTNNQKDQEFEARLKKLENQIKPH